MVEAVNTVTEKILEFWFSDEMNGKWFVKEPVIDAKIEASFGPFLERDLEEPKSAESFLAYIILYDQFPRNIYRGSPKAFSFDAQALHFALEGIERGLDQELTPSQRRFFYMPLMHSESIEVHKKSLEIFGELARGAPSSFALTYDFAVQHRDIIARFGRYPHRNAVLGRTSTAEEEEFLRQPGSSF